MVREEMVLPDYFVRVPTIIYTDEFGHRTHLRYDLLEKDAVPEETFYYCRGCRQYRSMVNAVRSPEDAHNRLPDSGVIWVGYPPSIGGAKNSRMTGKGIARRVDDAITKTRILQLLISGRRTQKQVADELGITQQRVSQVAVEVANMIREPELVSGSTVDLDTAACIDC